MFVRAPRHVILTEAGEQLLHRARHILREHDAALDEIAELAGAERGRLRIGSASAMVTTEQLPKILRNCASNIRARKSSVALRHQRGAGATDSGGRNGHRVRFAAG